MDAVRLVAIEEDWQRHNGQTEGIGVLAVGPFVYTYV